MLIDGKARRGKALIGESANRNGRYAGPAHDDVGKRRPADRAKPVRRAVTAIGNAFPNGEFAGESHIRIWPAGLSCEGASTAFLALKAMADGDPDGLAHACRAELPASACRYPFDHSFTANSCSTRLAQ